MEIKKRYYKKLIKEALKEDMKGGIDVTTDPIFTKKQKVVFKLLAKADGILCGRDIFTEVFKTIDKKTKVEFYFDDGQPITKGSVVARVYGDVKTILKGERTALNFISHLSGVSTKTSLFVKEAANRLKILDTRKTIPGLRMLQKYAVFCGGGKNHRIGLYDMALIKDNHIDAAGSITNAVKKIRNKYKYKYNIEVETRNLTEVEEAIKCNVDRIMLDNMDIDTMKKAVSLINKRCEVEASGNMTLERINEVAETGVDFISFGELTHTVTVFDFSLKKE
ncbi:MAG TPA: carboxylating nicotinate-nucleotide diphosphorylase [Spirochaetota bacterium]|nr:carboxylating nicotinate-nucleotide diphosphorylase [Spirochaetota bacterium]